MARIVEFLLAPLVFLTIISILALTMTFFAIGWCAGALVAGWRAGRGGGRS